MQCPVQYRPSEQTEWHQGETRNMSRSGLLFLAHEFLPIGAELEIRVVFKRKNGVRFAADVVCSGEVVRTEPDGMDAGPITAVRIKGYRFAGTAPSADS